jgi:multicomponent K+:H+ antiporter subunit G
MGGGGPAISLSSHLWLIIIFLSLTVPVTNTLLARTELFRRRTSPQTVGGVPAPLSHLARPAQDAGIGQSDAGQNPNPKL